MKVLEQMLHDIFCAAELLMYFRGVVLVLAMVYFLILYPIASVVLIVSKSMRVLLFDLDVILMIYCDL